MLLGWVALQMGPTADGDPNWLATTLDTIGSSFVTLLKAIVPPLVFLAIVTSIANLQQVTNAARLAWQTLLWFAITARDLRRGRHRARPAVPTRRATRR